MTQNEDKLIHGEINIDIYTDFILRSFVCNYGCILRWTINSFGEKYFLFPDYTSVSADTNQEFGIIFYL